MAHQFPLDPAGKVLLWSRPGREATLVAPSYPIFFIKKKKKKKTHNFNEKHQSMTKWTVAVPVCALIIFNNESKGKKKL
jgi:hypothetical protein